MRAAGVLAVCSVHAHILLLYALTHTASGLIKPHTHTYSAHSRTQISQRNSQQTCRSQSVSSAAATDSIAAAGPTGTCRRGIPTLPLNVSDHGYY